MRRTLAGLLLLCGSVAHAQDAPTDGAAEDEAARTRFYDFEELELQGRKVKPKVLYTDARQRAQFEKLLELKRSFIPELRRSADGSAAVEGAR
ncbi:MAG: hypothetical protein H6704_03445 [Myxococcales bacterium]|nr:hypothetical protein [Myxococcales bacterium]